MRELFKFKRTIKFKNHIVHTFIIMSELVILISLKKEDDIICPPFSIMFLSSALKKAGFRTKVIHSSLEETEARLNEIMMDKPLFIGFSLFTGLYCKYSAILSKKIKMLDASIPILWGGVHPSLLTEQCCKEDYIDYVIFREGEDTIVEFAQKLKNKESLHGVKGLAFEENGKVFIGEKRPFIDNLEQYPLDWDCINVEDYILNRKITYSDGRIINVKSIGYYSSRGCPFNCAFCYNLGYNDRKWRGAPSEAVIADINKLKQKYDINHVIFWDDLFFVNRKRSFDILKGTGIYCDAEVRLDFVNEQNAQEFIDHNVTYFLVGAESGSDRLLKFINKGFDTKFMIEKAHILAKYKIPVQYSFILGLPTETKEETIQTIDFMYKIYKIHSDASYTVGIFMPYPGTPLYEISIKNGFVPPSRTEDWEIVDRWRNTVELPWINNILCLNVRIMFAFLTDKQIPRILRNWIEFRIKRKWLYMHFDLKLMVVLNKFFLKNTNYNKFSIVDNFNTIKQILTLTFKKYTVNFVKN